MTSKCFCADEPGYRAKSKRSLSRVEASSNEGTGDSGDKDADSPMIGSTAGPGLILELDAAGGVAGANTSPTGMTGSNPTPTAAKITALMA